MRSLPSRRCVATCWLALAPCLSSCAGGDAAAPVVNTGAPLTLTTVGLPALDAAREGTYEAWAIDGTGRAHSAGRFVPSSGEIHFASPADGVRAFEVTVEPSGDVDDQPSPARLLHGGLAGGRAELSVVDAVTLGAPFKETPGTFTMFSPSDNATAPYPSHEEAGVWLFNMRPRETPQNDMWVRLTQLQPGWTYEGWMVRDLGTPGEIWLSYGKFVPDATGALSQKDDTGWGPFSGVINFRTESVEDFPGDDWISNPLGYPFPAQLTLPLNLREKNAAGQLRWTHVITVEPASDRGEAIGSERPFVLRPYRDSFGDLGAGVPRNITYRGDAVPRGAVEVR
jgi:anti-sigma-K factor RskA